MIQLKECQLNWDQNEQLIPVGKKTFLDDCYIDFQKLVEDAGTRYLLQIHPKQSLHFNSVKCIFTSNTSTSAKFFSNGFQSWSASKLVNTNEVIEERKNSIPRNILDGRNTNSKPNSSWTYGYIQDGSNNLLIGSLNESTGFTILNYLPEKAAIEVTIDCAGLHMEHSFPILDIWVAEGESLNSLLENYSAKFPTKEIKKLLLYSGAQQESEVTSALKIIQKHNIRFDTFLLPPGSHAEIGDWLTANAEKFPNGFAAVGNQIKSGNLNPAIWIAPLICSQQSNLFKNHPDWILKEENGKPLKIRTTPEWGNLYALNFKHASVQDYLIGVIHTLIEKWGFDCIYVDYLFVACLGKEAKQTNGQLMNEVIEFLNTQVGEKTWIAGGVPIGSALANVKYVEVGNLVIEQKKNPWWNFFGKPVYEGAGIDFSNFIERHHLNNVAFGNAMNLFSEMEKLKSLTGQQELSVVRAQSLLGCVTNSTSSLNDVSNSYIEGLVAAAKLRNAKMVKAVTLGTGLFEIQFEASGQRGIAWFNLTEELRKFTKGSVAKEIGAYESFVFKL